ncbi:MAG: type VI secretion system tip protein VgrG [Lentisphaerae bacterium]|nr:type VI secretion system tip protein VgrG [Lentisphaerota bacterium]MCP4099898.1 type VI secretion system tip protein VgrG [Lentisphaerota bacterium]
MPIYTQHNRSLQIEVDGLNGQDSFGNDLVLLNAIESGSYLELSNPFELYLNLLSPTTSDVISEDKILGCSATIKLKQNNGDWRVFNGIFETFHIEGYYSGNDYSGLPFVNKELFQYRAKFCPKINLMRKSRKNRILRQTKAHEIVEKLLTEWNINHEFKLSDSIDETSKYYELEQSVQHQESDFDYINRLLEKEGIYYYFEHTVRDDNSEGYCHKMVFRDSNQQNIISLNYVPGSIDDNVFAFSKGEEIAPRLLRMGGYDYRQADINFFDNDDHSISQNTMLGSHADKMRLDTPYADFVNLTDKAEAAAYRSKLKSLAGERARGEAYNWLAKTGNRTIDVGTSFELNGFPTGSIQGIISRIELEARTTPYTTDCSTISQDDVFSFAAVFKAQSLECNFRPQLKTKMPVINSMLTAKVITVETFPSELSTFSDALGGNQAWLDMETCRIKLLLQWYNTKPDSSTPDYESMWLYARFSQIWADPNSGSFEIPRRGQEVLVAFNNGNPERPVVIGSTYNSTVKPPVNLEDQRNLYSSFLRSSTVTEDGEMQSENPLATDVTIPMSVYDLGKQSKQKHFSQISFMNMDNGDFDETKVDQTSYLTEFFLPGAQGPFLSCIEEGKRMAGTGGDGDGSGNFEGINIYSNKDVLNQASQSQFINAGKDINICAGSSLTLQVGRSKLVLKDDGITMINSLGDPVWNCGYVEDYRDNDDNAPSKPKVEIPSFSSCVTLFPGYAGLAAPQTEILGTYKSDLKTWFGSEISSTLGHLGVRGLNLSLGGGSTLIDVFSDLNQLVKQVLDTINTNVEGQDGSIVPEAGMAGCTVIDSIMFIKDIFVETYAIITALKSIFALKSSSIEMAHDSLELACTKIVHDGLAVDNNGNPLGPYIGTIKRAANSVAPGSGSLLGRSLSMSAINQHQVNVANVRKRALSDDSVQLSKSCSSLNSSTGRINQNGVKGSGNNNSALGSKLDLSKDDSSVIGSSINVSQKEATAVRSQSVGMSSENVGLHLGSNGTEIVNTGLDIK